MGRIPEPIRSRIENNIERIPFSGCWLWTGYVGRNGYGEIGISQKTMRAHRVAYEELIGPIPQGLYLCHKCDVRSCVNPAHLFPATQLENIRDCIAKGRSAKMAGIPRPRRAPLPTHCQRGHKFTKKIATDGKRRCLVCKEIGRVSRREARRVIEKG